MNLFLTDTQMEENYVFFAGFDIKIIEEFFVIKTIADTNYLYLFRM